MTARRSGEAKKKTRSRGKPASKRGKRKPVGGSRSVFCLGDGKADGRAGLPPGFTLGTAVSHEFAKRGGRLPKALKDAARKALARVERVMGARFGDSEQPLLVSQLDAVELRQVGDEYLALVEQYTGRPFPQAAAQAGVEQP